MSQKEFLKNYRLGFSKNYLDKSRFKPEDNFPLYGEHKCLVRKHLTQEVSVWIPSLMCIAYNNNNNNNNGRCHQSQERNAHVCRIRDCTTFEMQKQIFP